MRQSPNKARMAYLDATLEGGELWAGTCVLVMVVETRGAEAVRVLASYDRLAKVARCSFSYS